TIPERPLTYPDTVKLASGTCVRLKPCTHNKSPVEEYLNLPFAHTRSLKPHSTQNLVVVIGVRCRIADYHHLLLTVVVDKLVLVVDVIVLTQRIEQGHTSRLMRVDDWLQLIEKRHRHHPLRGRSRH